MSVRTDTHRSCNGSSYVLPTIQSCTTQVSLHTISDNLFDGRPWAKFRRRKAQILIFNYYICVILNFTLETNSMTEEITLCMIESEVYIIILYLKGCFNYIRG